MQSRAATAAAEPPDEPPGTSASFAPRRRQGLTTGPRHELSFDEPIANSSLLSLPSITAPSRQRLAETLAPQVGNKHSRMCAQAAAGRSLPAAGMPSSGGASPAARRASAVLAIARA